MLPKCSYSDKNICSFSSRTDLAESFPGPVQLLCSLQQVPKVSAGGTGAYKPRLLGFLSESLQMYSQLQPDMDNVYKRLVFPKPLPHPTSQVTLWCCRRAWLHQLACITQTSQQDSHTPSGKGKSLPWLHIWLDPGAGFTFYRLRHTSYGEGGFSFVPSSAACLSAEG